MLHIGIVTTDLLFARTMLIGSMMSVLLLAWSIGLYKYFEVLGVLLYS